MRSTTLVLLVVSVYLVSLSPVLFAVVLGKVVERLPDAAGAGLSSPAGHALLRGLGAVVLLIVVERIAQPIAEIFKASAARQVDAELRVEAASALRDLDLADVESADVQADAARVKGSFFGTPGASVVGLMGLTGRYVQTLGALTVVGQLGPPLAIGIGVVLLIIRHRWQRQFFGLSDAIVGAGGKMLRATYVSDLAVGPFAAKELRIFGMLDWLTGRTREAWSAAVEQPGEVRTRLRRAANVELGGLTATYVVTFFVLARMAVNGDIELSVVASVAQATFLAASIIVPNADDFALEHGRSGTSVPDELRARRRPRRPGSVVLAEDAPTQEIRFEHVSFSYPGSNRPVVDGLDLVIPARRSMAIVGSNGAGKTTLVKLLSGLYRPTAGRVLVDGVDLVDIDLPSWHRRLAVIFQDFVHFSASAHDNVAFGAVDARATDADLAAAAEEAGASAVVTGLPAGWETVLSTQFVGGVDLSGGQWQRLALARALFAVGAGASVLVLDEPTANLDVRAEAEIYDRFLEMTSGTTGLVISHRFSTVRRADVIAVLEGGRIVETGSHDELVERGGVYADMFHVQAAQFSSTPVREVTSA